MYTSRLHPSSSFYKLPSKHTSPPILADPLREPPEPDEAVSGAWTPWSLLVTSPVLLASGAGLVTMTGAGLIDV